MKNNYLKTALLFICTSIFSDSFSQINPQIQWQELYGGPGDEWAIASRQTYDGGFISCNTRWMKNGDALGAHGTWNNYEIWLIKTNSQGDTLWTRAYGGTDDEYARNIIQTTDSGFVFLAETYSNDGDLDTNYGSWDFWVVKLDKTGQIQWQKSYGGTSEDDPRDVVQMPDGTYFVAGVSESNDVFLTGNNGEEDYWVIKLSANGNLLWQKNYGGDWTDLLKSIAVGDNEIYLTGYSWSDSTGDVTFPNIGYYDYWILKIDTAGNKLWNKRMGGTGGDIAYSCDLTSDNGIIVGGHAGTDDGDVDTTYGFFDFWLVKMDSLGNVQWKKSYGGNDDENLRTVFQTPDNGYFVSGYTWSTSGMVTGQHGLADVWVVKLDATGAVQWKQTLGGSADDHCYQSIWVNDQGYLLSGFTESNNSGDVGPAIGNGDSWLVKLLCSPAFDAEICMVTYDSLTGKNKVVWEDAGYPANIESVNVYRETGVTNVYALIGNVLVDSLSEYIDTAAAIDPRTQSYRYKIAAVDSCGNVSDTSSAHRTVVLIASPSGTNDINLAWNDYEGFIASSYKIYRYTNSAPTPTLIATKPAGSSPMIDNAAPQNDTARYFIKIVPPTACSSSKNYNESRSNTAANGITTLSIKDNSRINEVSISPNPSNGFFNVSVKTETNENIVLEVYNIPGQKIYTGIPVSRSANSQYFNVDMKDAPKGIYFMNIKTKEEIITRKLIVQ